MSHRRAKKIRKALRSQGIKIGASPWTYDGVQIRTSKYRQAYKKQKRALAEAVA